MQKRLYLEPSTVFLRMIVTKKYCWYFSDCVWWNYIFDVCCIKKKKKKITIATNVTIDCHSKKVRDCYILHTVLLVIILILIFAIISCHYAKQKTIDSTTM